VLWMIGAVALFYLLIRTRLWILAYVRGRRLPADGAKP
jgi:hypothetical protein